MLRFVPHFRWWLVCLSLVFSVAASVVAGERRILFIAGPPSHAHDEHEFPRGCALLADALHASGLPVRAEVVLGWPSEAQLAQADVTVIYSDGLEQHVAAGAADDLRRHWVGGKGGVVLHFALEPPTEDAALRELLLERLGGAFEAGWSVNPKWTLDAAPSAAHPAARGVGPLQIHDEWYYHLRLQPDVDVLLAGHPGTDTLGHDGPRSGNPAVRAALAQGVPQVLAWTREVDGFRGFGFSGGHFHRNWYEEGFRRLVLNGIIWAAGLEVPAAGVQSPPPQAPVYQRIDDAIAKGDVVDVQRHLREAPERARSGDTPARRAGPLHQALLRRQPEIARLLIEAGAELDRPDGAGRTPLHLAVIRDELALVDLLLERGAPLGLLDQQGWTPLHHAAARRSAEAARRLLQAGADPNARSGAGGTPLHEAAAAGALEVGRLLVAAGTDPAVRSASGVTALDLAREFQQPEFAQWLESLPR